MAVSLVQGILLSVLAMIGGLDFWLEIFYIHRPIIMGTLAGLILGNLTLGVIIGGTIELVFAGLTSAGGTQPPNPVLTSIMAVVFAHTTSVTPTASLGLALPFGFLMMYVIVFYRSAFSLLNVKLDKYAAAADTKRFMNVLYFALFVIGVSYLIITFLCTYALQGPMSNLVQMMPKWATNAFTVAGGVMPAVGFAMLLRIMLKGQFIPYILIGFFIASMIPFGNVLPAAVVGTALAVIEFFRDREIAEVDEKLANNATNGNGNGGDDDGI